MRIRVLSVLGAVVALWATTFGQGAARATARVVVDADFAGGAFLAAVETAISDSLPFLEERLGSKLPQDERIVVHFFATYEAYEKAVTDVGAAVIASNGAGTAAKNRESYVVVAPSSDPTYLARVGNLPDMTLTLALHETVHQLVARSGLFPDWYLPDWYCEGRADYLADLAAVRLRGRPSPYYEDHRLRRLLLSGTPLDVSMADLMALKSAALADRPSDAYCWRFAFFEYLTTTKDAEHSKALKDLTAYIQRRGRPGGGSPAAPVVQEINDYFLKRVGDAGRLEAAFRAALVPPTTWASCYRAIDVVGDRIEGHCLARGQNSLALSPRLPKGERYEISGDVKMHPSEEAQVDLMLVFEPASGFELKLAITGSGWVHLLAYVEKEWKNLGKSRWSTDAKAAAEAISFKVAMDGRKVRGTVGGEKVAFALPADLKLPKRRTWGIGSFKTSVTYRNVSCRDL